MAQGSIKRIFISKYKKERFSVFLPLIFLLFLLLSLSANAQSKLTPVILESAELAVCGNTNVNSFTCQLFKQHLNDTLSYISATADGAELFNGLVLRFNVSDFACNHSMMTNDFRTLLKGEEFPYIVMSINNVVVHKPSKQGGHESTSAHITLHLAGQSKEEYIDDVSIEQTAQWLVLKGSHKVLMTSFEIQPPTKFFGTILTEDTIEILFSIKVKE